jgi:hypothetical protein
MKFALVNLIEAGVADDAMVEDWRRRLRKHGGWANEPAGERALDHCLPHPAVFGDTQNQRPLPIPLPPHELEHTADCRRR